jgi:hypothetical protein
MSQPFQVSPLIFFHPLWWADARAVGVSSLAAYDRASALPSAGVVVHASRFTSGRREASS